MADEIEMKADWEAIRQAALRSLHEDLAMAAHMALLRLYDNTEIIKRRIALVQKMVFVTLDANNKPDLSKDPTENG